MLSMGIKRVVLFFVFLLSSLLYGEDSSDIMRKGLESYNSSNFLDATFYFSKISKDDSEIYPEALYWLAKSHYKEGRFDDSRKVIEKFFRTGNLIDYYEDAAFLHCIVYFKLERYEDSLHLLQQFINDKEYKYYKSIAYFWLGEAYLQLGEYSEAIDSYNSYLELDPENLTVLKRIETTENAIELLSESGGEELTSLDKANWFVDYIIREKDFVIKNGDSRVLRDLSTVYTKEDFFSWLDNNLYRIQEIPVDETEDISLYNPPETEEIANDSEKDIIISEPDYDALEELIMKKLDKKSEVSE